MIEVDEVDDGGAHPGGPVELPRSGVSPAVFAGLAAVIAVVLAVVALGDDDGRSAAPTTTTSSSTTTSAPPTIVDASSLPDAVRSLDLLLYGGADGPARLEMESGVLRRHEGGDLLTGRELDVLGSFAGGIVLRPGLVIDWDLDSAWAFDDDVWSGNAHITPDGVWHGGDGSITFSEGYQQGMSYEYGGTAEVYGAFDGAPLVWRRQEGTIERVEPTGPATTVAEGTPLLGGEGWIGTVACSVEFDPAACDLELVDLVTGIDWVAEEAFAGSMSVSVVSSGGRRGIVGFGRPDGADDVVLIDADELVVRPIDLTMTDGAAFDPSERYVLHGVWGVEAPLLCALDLETGSRSCLDPGFDFGRVLVVPPG
ncbi:MAG: hypothetical protein AAFZ07_04545 [Actinomycetota bacterium]